jgi:hypothetical protein
MLNASANSTLKRNADYDMSISLSSGPRGMPTAIVTARGFDEAERRAFRRGRVAPDLIIAKIYTFVK